MKKITIEAKKIEYELNNDGLYSIFFQIENGYLTFCRNLDEDEQIYIEHNDQSNAIYINPQNIKYVAQNGKMELVISEDVNLETDFIKHFIIEFSPVGTKEYKKIEKALTCIWEVAETEETDFVKEWNLSSFKKREDSGFLFTKQLVGHEVNGGVGYSRRKESAIENLLKVGKNIFSNVEELDKNAKEIIENTFPNVNVTELNLNHITFDDVRYFSFSYLFGKEQIIVQFKKNFKLEQILKI